MLEKFFKEMYGMETIHMKEGFITFKKYEDSSVWIEMCWVKPKHRGEGATHKLLQAVRDKTECRAALCHVDKKTEFDYSVSAQMIMANGFKILDNKPDYITFIQEF
jgi:hypothetical protein